MKRPDWLRQAGMAGLEGRVRVMHAVAALMLLTGGATAAAAVGVTHALSPGKRTIDLTHGAPGPPGPKGDTGPAGPRGPQGPAGEGDGTFTKCPVGYELDDLTINHPGGHITILACVKE